MPTINITDSVTLDRVLDTSATLNMTSQQTLDFLTGAIFLGRTTARIFNYEVTFSAQSPECVASFSRSFSHRDWIDGESVVQAETTSLEEGFNSRFHAIEDDLDALGADVGKVFTCLGQQRAEISERLDEIKSEINRINSDVHNCCADDGPVIGPVYPGPIFPNPPVVTTPPTWPPITYPPINPTYPIDPPIFTDPVFGGGFPPLTHQPLNPWINPGIVTADPWDAGEIDPVVQYVNGVTGIGSYHANETVIARSNQDPNRAVISGMQARLIETNEFNGRNVEVWSTPVGIMLTPLSEGQETGTGDRPNWTNPHVSSVGRMAKWVAENEKPIKEQLGSNGFALNEFTEKFGENTLEGGLKIKRLLGGMPSATKFESPLQIVDALSEVSAKSINLSGRASETVIGAIGLNKNAKNVEEISPEALKIIDSKSSKAMQEAGVKSMLSLADSNPAELSEKLKSQGVEASPAEVAQWRSTARTLVNLDKLARNVGG